MCPQFGFLKLIRFFVFYKSFFFVMVIIAIFISRKNIVILCERCLQDMEWKNDTPASNKKKKTIQSNDKKHIFWIIGLYFIFCCDEFLFRHVLHQGQISSCRNIRIVKVVAGSWPPRYQDPATDSKR